MSNIRNKTLKDLYNSSDSEIAKSVREFIDDYYSMDLDKRQIGVICSERLKDVFVVISITGDIDS